MSRHINYTKAELISFAEVPETCDEIDRQLNSIAQLPLNIDDVLKSYGIELTKNLKYAIHEIFMKATSVQISNARRIIHYKCTFPLRLALVKRIEANLLANGEVVKENHYQHWINQGIGLMENINEN